MNASLISTNMKDENLNLQDHLDSGKLSEQYDIYAPSVYGKILNMVNHVPIAENILEHVFLKSNVLQKNPGSLQSPLLMLINQASGKTQRTIKALEIFKACCSGTSIGIKSPE